eukprot:gene18180-24616_t
MGSTGSLRGGLWKAVAVIISGFMVAVASQAPAAVINSTSYLASQRKGPTYTVAEIWAKHVHLPTFDKIQQSSADTFAYLPKDYDATFKSPCWRVTLLRWRNSESTQLRWRCAGQQVKCLPYFQILGVSKCGTTDLFHRLTANPDMVDSSWKGPHFWDEQLYPSQKTPNPNKYDGTFEAYVRIFDKAANGAMLENPRVITADASSNTFTGALTFCRGVGWPRKLNVTLPQLLWEATPFARFIVMFRDPVDRYYSAFNYYRPRKMGHGSPQQFHEQAKTDIKAWDMCVSKFGEDACQLVKGMFGLFFPAWFEVWPRDRFMIIRNEDYKVEPLEHVAAVVEFLGMAPMSNKEQESAVKMEARNVKKYDSMLYETRVMLQDFYRPFNQRLSKLLGDDPRWLWEY